VEVEEDCSDGNEGVEVEDKIEEERGRCCP
jgi:hypothetical protein